MIRNDRAPRSLAARIGLDYFAIDCGKTGDGALLIFLADNTWIRGVFDAFEAMLRTKALEGAR